MLQSPELKLNSTAHQSERIQKDLLVVQQFSTDNDEISLLQEWQLFASLHLRLQSRACYIPSMIERPAAHDKLVCPMSIASLF